MKRRKCDRLCQADSARFQSASASDACRGRAFGAARGRKRAHSRGSADCRQCVACMRGARGKTPDDHIVRGFIKTTMFRRLSAGALKPLTKPANAETPSDELGSEGVSACRVAGKCQIRSLTTEPRRMTAGARLVSIQAGISCCRRSSCSRRRARFRSCTDRRPASGECGGCERQPCGSRRRTHSPRCDPAGNRGSAPCRAWMPAA